ncbi:xanthine dehydrogenase family protein molybdopterin-binding subunit [Saccharopolyspora rhizosphaerae]|uniref:Xanthine dehydrogenase family protein molybdopterin-binding subunit n=1 Tax=Saccharopolyspora rhizosphaerae TaxID=2492662 RepID=A0A3R8P7J8_9PSEU|nr:xanthine dehydrogenase family protein molybdopterin-binding subunit [Saccharopolyspora rhizosphaerae]RRO18043.1 xanthine dehydrogenase family protein molybdopterin-binding subunit [Saccharopolyspora rhizosphaerae]
MVGSLLGTEVQRVEDPDLLRGQGTYIGNLAVEGMLHIGFVRSHVAHAEIAGIDTSAAAEAPGIVGAFTAADLDLPVPPPFVEVNPQVVRPPLATDRVRFVGEPVAVLVGESAEAVADAVELVDVDYRELPVVTDPERALDEDAELQFPGLGSNVAAGFRDRAGGSALNGADVVVRARIENQRVAVVPLEGNAVAVQPGGPDRDHDITVHVSTQMPHGVRAGLAKAFGFDKDRVRVISPHVGGGFGGKAGAISEHVVAVGLALRLGRPVRWVEGRSENMQGMPHGRAQVQYAELGLRRDGKIVGMRCRVIGDCGAYAGFGGSLALGPTRTMAQAVYDIPKISYDGVAVLTNTTPVGAFRGAGRPEAAAMVERMVDLAAAELGEDPAALRRRNFLVPERFPYRTLTGATYDSGEYAVPFDEALRLAGYEELRAEQARRVEAGEPKLLGIGLSAYVEITGGGSGEYAEVEVHADGARIRVGTSAHGQGHATAFAMIVNDTLGIPLDKIEFIQSDTAEVPRGGGTGGSRSLQIGGSAVREAGTEVLQRAKELAASRLEADVDDIEVTDGGLGVTGVPSATVAWADLVEVAEGEGERLAANVDFAPDGATFPFGAHVSVVEVDVETGQVTPLRHIAVDDCGRVLNPMLVRGQQHGGAAQGIAQALWEQVTFDAEGNPETGTLADYTIPSAADLPSFEVTNTETLTPLNPLGAKGIGESATVGSTPAVQNAVVDALKHLGVRHIDMPTTPERVWKAVRDGASATSWQEPPAAFAALPLRADDTPDEEEAVV